MTFTKYYTLLFFTIIALFCLCSDSNGQKLRKLTGKITDTQQKINIFLIPDCKNCNIDALETYNPDENGGFLIDFYSNTKYRLFLEEEFPESYWAVVNYPQGTITYLPEFKGVPVFYSAKKFTFNIGTVEPTIKYTKSEIDLSKLIGKADYSNIRIQTRDRNGRKVGNKMKPEERFWTDGSKLKVFYPQGKWILDIFIDQNGRDKKVGAVRL